jgi:hypothetical protein
VHEKINYNIYSTSVDIAYYLHIMISSHYKFFPSELSHVHVALFTNVQNAPELRSRLIKASTMEGPEGEEERGAVNFAFVDASPVRLLVSYRKLLH